MASNIGNNENTNSDSINNHSDNYAKDDHNGSHYRFVDSIENNGSSSSKNSSTDYSGSNYSNANYSNPNYTNYPRNNVIEIDLVRVLKQFLVQWRAIVLCAIILGLIAGALRYVSDKRTYQIAVANVGNSADKTIEDSELTSQQIEDVKQAVAQKKKINDLTEYMADSIYMNLDAMNSKRLSLLYYIKAEDGMDAADLLTVYKQMLSTDDSIKEIKKAAGLKDTANKYVRELISVYDAKGTSRTGITQETSTDIMEIDFILPEKTDPVDVGNAISKLVSAYDVNALGIGKGTVRRISSDVNVVMDTGMQSAQQNNAANLYSYKSSYESSVNSFSEEQKDVLERLLRESKLYDTDTAKNLDAARKKAEEAEEDSTDGEDTEEGKVKLPDAPSFSVKYFAIGFILGILLYMFLEVVYEILKSRWSMMAGSSMRRLGSLYDPERHKNNFLLCDKLLYRLLYKKEMDTDGTIERILTKAQMHSGYRELQSLELWTVGTPEDAAVKRIVDFMASKGLDISVRQASDGRPDEMIETATEGRSVALVVTANASRKKDASFLEEMLISRRTDYVGLIELI